MPNWFKHVTSHINPVSVIAPIFPPIMLADSLRHASQAKQAAESNPNPTPVDKAVVAVLQPVTDVTAPIAPIAKAVGDDTQKLVSGQIDALNTASAGLATLPTEGVGLFKTALTDVNNIFNSPMLLIGGALLLVVLLRK